MTAKRTRRKADEARPQRTVPHELSAPADPETGVAELVAVALAAGEAIAGVDVEPAAGNHGPAHVYRVGLARHPEAPPIARIRVNAAGEVERTEA